MSNEYNNDSYLTSERVRTVYERCFRPEAEYSAARINRAQVEAWMLRHTFSVPQLGRSREEIIRMLLCLQSGFRVDEKGGGSVGAATIREDGSFWTGDMSDVEKLVSLGVAVGLVSFPAPREKWSRLPGGLPYICVEIKKTGVSLN